MAHEAPEPPDRRPVLYAALALVIFVAAAFLFWPRGDESQPRLTLTPTDSQTATHAADSPMGAVDRALDDGGNAMVVEGKQAPEGDVRASHEERLPDSAVPDRLQRAAQEADRKAERDTPAEPVGSTTTKPVTAKKPAATKPKPARTSPSTTNTQPPASTTRVQPATSGDFKIWVGSFRDESNAIRRVKELAELGAKARIVESQTEAGLVYRVQLGWFASREQAKTYGEGLRQRGISYWVDRR